RIFNDYLFGGFLIYYTPGLKVFIDDRCELYGDDWLIQYSKAMQGDSERIDGWFADYDFQYGLVATGSAFDRHLQKSPDWTVLKRTGAAALYRRDTLGKAMSEGPGGVARVW